MPANLTAVADRRGGHERPGRQGAAWADPGCRRSSWQPLPTAPAGEEGPAVSAGPWQRPDSVRWAAEPIRQRLPRALVGPGQLAAAGVLQAQTTPPDRFARSERMSHEIDPRRVLLVGDQSLDEFPRPHPLTEKRPRLFLESKWAQTSAAVRP